MKRVLSKLPLKAALKAFCSSLDEGAKPQIDLLIEEAQVARYWYRLCFLSSILHCRSSRS